jgi:uroporphyrinogen-III decarboxylase
MLKGGRPDRLPLMPITMMFAADRLGVKYSEYARNHEVLVEGQIRTAEEFGFDHVSSISDPAREAADYGAHVQWYDDQPPALVEDDSLLAEKGKLAPLKPIDPLGEGRMHDRIRAIELLNRTDWCRKVRGGLGRRPLRRSGRSTRHQPADA